MPMAPKVGIVLPCICIQALSWGSKVRAGDYWGTARGASATVGEHIHVYIDSVEGNTFKGVRVH